MHFLLKKKTDFLKLLFFISFFAPIKRAQLNLEQSGKNFTKIENKIQVPFVWQMPLFLNKGQKKKKNAEKYY